MAYDDRRRRDEISERLERDGKHWWTRWIMVQGHEVVQVIVLGVLMGAAAMLWVLTVTGGYR